MSDQNPLGITEQARRRGQEQATIDEIRAAGRQLLTDIERNLAALDALPTGIMLWCRCCQRTHPIEAFR
jgi:hypothetical protein